MDVGREGMDLRLEGKLDPPSNALQTEGCQTPSSVDLGPVDLNTDEVKGWWSANARLR